MQIVELHGASIGGIYSCLPANSEDNLARCIAVYGDEKKALSVVKATGIKKRRIVCAGTSSLDLCVAAAERLIFDMGIAKEEIGAVISVTFTPERTMPCNACQAQRRLDLPTDMIAFDINLACSGWAYGLYVAGMFAKALGRKVLLLDGDTQTPYMDSSDMATVPVMADAGTATLLAPTASVSAMPWRFAFLTNGAKGDSLMLPFGGKITMDGLGIFKFVTMDVLNLIRNFMIDTGETPDSIDAFVPHQANIFMIEQIAKKLGFGRDKLWVSGDVFGNSSSATVPTTIAHCGSNAAVDKNDCLRLLVSGFGGGLSASVGLINLRNDCLLKVFDYEP